MKLSTEVILNPSYYLKPDKNRAVLMSLEDTRENKYGAIDSFSSIIHPFYAIILSFFQGNNYSDTIKNIVNYTNCNEELIDSFVKKIINNKDSITITIDKVSMIFPPYTLIDKTEEMSTMDKTDYSIFDVSEIDLVSQRYNYPSDITLMVNNICKTNCIYCYADRRNPQKLSFEFSRLKELIKEAKKLHLRNFDVIGGEFFLYKDWELLLKELHDNGFRPYVSTKIPITKNEIDRYKSCKMEDIQFSLDSTNTKVLKELINAPKNYLEELTETLKYLEECEIQVYIHTIITKKNTDIQGLKELYEYLCQFKNIKHWQIDEVAKSIYLSDDNWYMLRPSKKEFIPLIKYCNEIKSEDKINISFPAINQLTEKESLSEKESQENLDMRNACSGNLTNFFVLPDGKVTICEELYWHPKFIIGDLTKQSILEVWNSPEASKLFNYQQNDVREESNCSSCGQFKSCHDYKHICWKEVVRVYGEDNWDYSLPDCPNAMPHIKDIYIEN